MKSSAPKPRLKLDVISAAAIEPERVSWLWDGRIPRGMLSVVVGHPDAGKSLLSIDLAARVSRGDAWPDGAAGESPGRVLLLGVEDHLRTVVLPRLIAAGADRSRVELIRGVFGESGVPMPVDIEAHAELLGQIIEERGDVRLIVVDPILGFLDGRRKSNNEQDVRAAMDPLARLAEKYELSVLGVTHFRKQEAGNPLHRMQGSQAFGALVRVAWIVAEGDGGVRHFVPVKFNIGRRPFGLTFSINDGGRIAWGGKSAASAEDLAGTGKKRRDRGPTAAQKSADWIRNRLASGPEWAETLEHEVREADHLGFSWDTLRQHGKRLARVQSGRDGATGPHYWYLPGENGAGPPSDG